jgi:DNA repair exonuclease SbcCD nuclease subunit
MIKKIIHIADIHIRTNQYHDLYEEQFERLYAELDKLEESKEHIRIVVAGDIFHQKINISNEQLIIASKFLLKLTQYGKVIIIPGNHDFLENNVQRLDSITPVVNLLNHKDIVYHKNMGVYEDENINWVVYSLYQHNEKPNFIREDDKFYIGLFHGPIQGFSTDTGYLFEDAYDKINFNGCDIILCGDIHKRAIQYLESEIEIEELDLDLYIKNNWELKSNNAKNKIKVIKKTPIIYPGSLIQQNFGETINHHGFGIYDIEIKKYHFQDLYNDCPFLYFKIEDIKDIDDGKEELLNLG